MTDMKCPFCNSELKHEKITGIYCCPRTFIDCPLGLGTGAFGTKELWQELIRARKALKIAVDALKLFCGEDVSYYSQSKIDARDARKALEQITALEQKD